MTPLGHQKLNSNKQEFIECIDSLFLKLELAYHYQFYKVFGTDDRLNEGKKLWAISLKSFSTETIFEGLESVDWFTIIPTNANRSYESLFRN